ncbi:MAG TPA: peptide-methionine (S)-S-oxide reductase MsrA [Bdellovibrionales bacterium]|nr:peptide-methionine (S)-S-oxide reductase MsrA [Bdellovibrionales bacterium]
MTDHLKTVVLAGGCFWGVEELLRGIPGVKNTEVGYTGGATRNPVYETVKLGDTGHAEAIKIDYSPEQITYRALLEMFFRMHDPTTLNRQGNDVGTQYRSTIFVSSPEEKAEAEAAIAAENRSGRWKRPVVTTIEPLKEFYSAESYHQDYLKKNPGGYNCHYWRE